MNKFGTLKSKILQKFTDAYANGNKGEIKDTLKLIKENKEFLNMYLFYEEIENKYIGDKESAEIFLEEITPLLKKHTKSISKFCKSLETKIGEVPITENELYSYLDTLTESDTLKNVHMKITARQKLTEHLITKKEVVEPISTTIIENESLLHTVLTSNFNALYGATLTEEEQNELKKILSISNEELEKNFSTLKEDVSSKMGKMLVEEKNIDLKAKLEKALDEVKTMNVTKYQYYKLQQLKNGL